MPVSSRATHGARHNAMQIPMAVERVPAPICYAVCNSTVVQTAVFLALHSVAAAPALQHSCRHVKTRGATAILGLNRGQLYCAEGHSPGGESSRVRYAQTRAWPLSFSFGLC